MGPSKKPFAHISETLQRVSYRNSTYAPDLPGEAPDCFYCNVTGTTCLPPCKGVLSIPSPKQYHKNIRSQHLYNTYMPGTFLRTHIHLVFTTTQWGELMLLPLLHK